MVENERTFFCCTICKLFFVDPAQRLSAEWEKARYALHTNNIEDQGYVNFLNIALKPALPFLDAQMDGLDFGCGPEPVLAALLGRLGLNCAYYDPYFFPDLDFKKNYHFIFSTECVEHFYNPGAEFLKLAKMLHPGGFLIIMTSFWQDIAHFRSWYYKNDPAHVCFYSMETFKYIATTYHFDIVHSDQEKVVIFKKR